MVNLVNHPQNGEPNVYLRWSEYSKKLLDSPMSDLQESSSQLLLEMVALRDIISGEEILLDYGSEWVEAWAQHVEGWAANEPPPIFVTSHELNQNQTILRTEAEQKVEPYPDNVFTSCFYSYAKRGSNEIAGTSHGKHPPLVVEEWKYFKGIYETSNMRPCLILDRYPFTTNNIKGDNRDQELRYTVRMMNRPGLAESESIPRSTPYLVKNVPRVAIVFSDKLYTTDQHLEAAFRHHIGLGDLFPTQWMDLVD
jgi:hypothetical protein